MTTILSGAGRMQRLETLEPKQPLAADLLGLGAVSPVVQDVVNVAQDVVARVDSTASHLLGVSPLATVQNTLDSAFHTIANLNLVDTLTDLTSGLLDHGAAVITNLTATLSGIGSATGAAALAVSSNGLSTAAQLTVHIENALANSIQPVMINGQFVGNIEVNAAGQGLLELSTDASVSGKLLSDVLPSLTANSSIQVGSLLNGTLSASASTSGASLGLNLTALTPKTVDSIFALL